MHISSTKLIIEQKHGPHNNSLVPHRISPSSLPIYPILTHHQQNRLYSSPDQVIPTLYTFTGPISPYLLASYILPINSLLPEPQKSPPLFKTSKSTYPITRELDL
jgi:hypothetical protein